MNRRLFLKVAVGLAAVLAAPLAAAKPQWTRRVRQRFDIERVPYEVHYELSGYEFAALSSGRPNLTMYDKMATAAFKRAGLL